MGSHFCCCLPLRFGVLLISFLEFCVTGAGAAGIWYLLSYLLKNNADDRPRKLFLLKTALIVGGVIYTVGALVGLFGCHLKKNGLVRTFLFALCGVLVFHIAGGVFILVMYYRARGQSYDDCLKQSSVPNQQDLCQAIEQLKSISQVSVIIYAVLPILIQAVSTQYQMNVIDVNASLIVYQYSRHLSKEKTERDQTFMAFKSRGPSYQPVAGHGDESHPLADANTAYPYSDASHSFGTNAPQKYDPYAPHSNHV
ncbi:hypothetical protein BDQ17DRAFT_1387725 [Cyathus striatus]|nr:hypothetical protein BDQ17DRAFT_1387725 [Cyathus striatus]